MTISHRPAGWPLRECDRGYPGVQRCRSVLARRVAGLPPCEDVAVWKVEETTKGMVRTGYYCNADLPEDEKRVILAALDAPQRPEDASGGTTRTKGDYIHITYGPWDSSGHQCGDLLVDGCDEPVPSRQVTVHYAIDSEQVIGSELGDCPNRCAARQRPEDTREETGRG